MDTKNEARLATKVSALSISINLLLTLCKFIAGILGGSAAMVSDAVHSASDMLSTIVVLVGVKASRCASDEAHPYGHERLESIASILLAGVLFLTGFFIGVEAVKKIIAGDYNSLAVPTRLPLIAALISIAAKEWMFWYMRRAGKILSSGALMADAWHQRTDALASLGSFFGILGARLGFPIMDAIAGLVICLFILKISIDVARDAVSKLTDRACDGDTLSELRRLILSQAGVLALDEIKTRLFGSKIYVDIAICVDGRQRLSAAHEISLSVQNAVKSAVPRVKDCTIHMRPNVCDASAHLSPPPKPKAASKPPQIPKCSP